jgi:hypothetical protein
MAADVSGDHVDQIAWASESAANLRAVRRIAIARRPEYRSRGPEFPESNEGPSP